MDLLKQNAIDFWRRWPGTIVQLSQVGLVIVKAKTDQKKKQAQ